MNKKEKDKNKKIKKRQTHLTQTKKIHQDGIHQMLMKF